MEVVHESSVPLRSQQNIQNGQKEMHSLIQRRNDFKMLDVNRYCILAYSTKVITLIDR